MVSGLGYHVLGNCHQLSLTYHWPLNVPSPERLCWSISVLGTSKCCLDLGLICRVCLSMLMEAP